MSLGTIRGYRPHPRTVPLLFLIFNFRFCFMHCELPDILRVQKIGATLGNVLSLGFMYRWAVPAPAIVSRDAKYGTVPTQRARPQRELEGPSGLYFPEVYNCVGRKVEKPNCHVCARWQRKGRDSELNMVLSQLKELDLSEN